MLLATRHTRPHAALTPASKAGTWFTYHGGMEGWVDLDVLIMPWQAVEPTIAWSKVWRPNRSTTEIPNILEQLYLHYSLLLRDERQSTQMLKITTDGLTRPGTGFIAVPYGNSKRQRVKYWFRLHIQASLFLDKPHDICGSTMWFCYW